VTAPGQPGYVAPGPYPYTYWMFARVLLVIGAICFAIAAMVAGGIFHGPMWAWGFGGFAAWTLAKAAGAP
jgi:hypothetical protein